MRRLARYYASATAIDCATYMAVTGLSYRAMGFGATPVVLGLIPAVHSLVYVSATLLTGRLSDRLPRVRLARLGAAGLAGAVALQWAARSIHWLFLSLPLMAIGLALFWPSLQAALAEADSPERLNGNLGRFNIAWSLGKGFGFASAGQLLALFGFNAPFGAALTLAALVAAFLRHAPYHPAGAGAAARELDITNGTAQAEPAGDAETAPAIVRRHFLWMAWIANALAYGVVATLNFHYPKYLASFGRGASLFGVFQGLVYFSETTTFLILRRWPGWHYRRAPLYLSQGLLASLVLALPFVHAPVLLLLLAPGIGMVIGLSYYSSLYYSLHTAEARGKNTGLHEAVLGSGSLIIPLIGGAVAAGTNQLAAPYFVCAGLGLAGLGAEEWIARQAPRREAAAVD